MTEKAIQKMADIGTKELKEGSNLSVASSLDNYFLNTLVKESPTYKDFPWNTHAAVIYIAKQLTDRKNIRPPQIHQYLMSRVENGTFVRQKGERRVLKFIDDKIIETDILKVVWNYRISEATFKARKDQQVKKV